MITPSKLPQKLEWFLLPFFFIALSECAVDHGYILPLILQEHRKSIFKKVLQILTSNN